MSAGPPLVRVQALAVAHPGRPVFRDVDFSVGAGELVALVGPNGAGKSTLLRALLGLEPPVRGNVTLGGRDVRALSRRGIARLAALLPQDAVFELPLTVRQTVALGRMPHLARFQAETSADVDAVDRAIAQADIGTLVDRPVVELSGGERQRVHLARALAQEAPLLLLDEPTANLDLAHQLQTLRLLRDIVTDGRAAIVALHDLSLAARWCDRMLLLAHGTLAADAAPADVLTPDALARHFGVRGELCVDGGGRPFVLVHEALPALAPKATGP
jgi:cobalamin transport system ATP-binding protein